MAGATPEQKEGNLLFAIDTLRKLNEKRANSPSFQTDLAEALSKVPRYKAEAYTILTQLAKKDLVASAEGYATLARLHEAMGEGAPRDAAVKRCEGMTKTPKACQMPAGPSTTRS
jgi:predicted Zn-dependent protease